MRVVARRSAYACAALVLLGAGGAATRPTDSGRRLMEGHALRPTELVGSWIADDPDTRSLTRVVVRRRGGEYLVRVWGRCHPTDCAWDEAAATLRSDTPKPELSILYEQGFSTKRMSLRVVEPGLLGYRLETTFNDNSGRADQVSEELLKRGPARTARAARR